MARIEVDGFDLFEQTGDIWMIRKNRSNRLRNIPARTKPAGGDLIQQRLEQMVILAVNQRDLRIGMPKFLAKVSPPKHRLPTPRFAFPSAAFISLRELLVFFPPGPPADYFDPRSIVFSSD